MVDYILHADPLSIQETCEFLVGLIAGCVAAFFVLNGWSL